MFKIERFKCTLSLEFNSLLFLYIVSRERKKDLKEKETCIV